MVEIISKIVANVLVALYQPFWFSLILAILLMQTYLTAKESSMKAIWEKWKENFFYNKKFRYLFYFFFYLTMILFRTLLNRDMWANPVSDVMGSWWIYDREGKLSTECFENMMLFAPFIFLFWLNFKERLTGEKIQENVWEKVQEDIQEETQKEIQEEMQEEALGEAKKTKEKKAAKEGILVKCIFQSIKISFLFSLAIEFSQLFLRLGTFQLSDLFYNTLGGLLGGLVYWGYEKRKGSL